MNLRAFDLMCQEADRFEFLVARDGLQGALVFAEATYKSYRKAVLQSRKTGHIKPHHASLPDYRESFIHSYLYLKQQVLNHAT